jgi:hypothetical protein
MFTSWIAQHFLNPAFFWPGVALVAAPIIIHLINRLRYRRVRFAAMEFLLQSEQKNRRRILLEQLLLLLMRVLIVLAIVALIARLILNQQQLSLFQGAQAHHVVLLDDSGSMRDRVGDETAFDRAKSVVSRLISDGARRPGANRFTLLLLSQPDSTYANLGERTIDGPFVQEVATKLDAIKCTHGRGDLLTGLEAARQRLAGDPSAATYLHVLSDFRSVDWLGSRSAAGVLQALSDGSVTINLVRAVSEPHDNLAVVDLSGAVEVAAAGIPVELVAAVQNFGTREATNVRLSVTADGQSLPLNLLFDAVPAGERVERRFEVEFDTAGKHRVAVSLESDALEPDNIRYLTLDVPLENDVLIVDGTPGGEQGLYVADALAADRSVTGYAPVVMDVDGLRRTNLSAYQSLYLLNVPELPPDALKLVDNFVEAGGALVWFVGDAVRPAFYNETLHAQHGLFPVRLAIAPQTLDHPEQPTGPDMLVEPHPIFRILSGQDNPFVDVVRVNRFYPVDASEGDGETGERENEPTAAEDDQEGGTAPDETGSDTAPVGDVKVLARLRTRDPLILEHLHGEGRIVTFLTSAGPLHAPEGGVWNNWASGPAAPSYAVVQLELQKHIARRDRLQPRRTVGEPIVEALLRRDFQENVEIITPQEELVILKAAAPQAVGENADLDNEQLAALPWEAVFRETDGAGVYVVRRFDNAGEPLDTWMAYNVPVEESPLAIAGDEALREQLGSDVEVTIQQAETSDWIRSESPGQDVRWWLLAGLLLLFVGEQTLAYRLGYHTR